MLVVISPAKKLDMSFDSRAPSTVPDFATDAATLAGVARDLSHDDLRALMSISPALAELNAKRFAEFGTQQVKAFDGVRRSSGKDWRGAVGLG